MSRSCFLLILPDHLLGQEDQQCEEIANDVPLADEDVALAVLGQGAIHALEKRPESMGRVEVLQF